MELRNRARLAGVTAGLLAATACGGAGGTAVQGTSPPATPDSGRREALAGTYDANNLKQGLLTAYRAARPAAPASASTVGALQDHLGLAGQLKSIKTKKPACLTAGPNLTSSRLRPVPASAITLSDARKGYTLGEVLFSADTKSMRGLVARPVPASCRHLTAHVSGRTVRIALRPIRMPQVARTVRGVMMTVVVGKRVQRSLNVMFADQKYGGTVSLSGPRVNRALLRHATVMAMRTARSKLA